jgi:hypothetical protein
VVFARRCAILPIIIDLSQETEALAQRRADAQRVTVEDAVRQALEARANAAGISVCAGLVRDGSPKAIAARRARISQFVQEIAAMPVLDRRSQSEIIDDLNAL